MHRRESTNAKLASIINAKKEDHDKERDLINDELKARIRLRRTSLYNGGARAVIPNVKKGKKGFSASPIALSSSAPNLHQPKLLESSNPPTAHSDMFRMVTNPTSRSANDPDHIFINSSSMNDGILHVPQPPWYVGNNNKIIPPETNLILSASRYGYRGSKEIMRYKTQPWEVPAKTHNEHTPKFLRTNQYVDEWAPPILATTYQTVNSIETPKLWPENTEYATGYPKKRYPKSFIYKRETTLATKDADLTTESVSHYMSRISENSAMIRDFARMESTKALESAPLSAKTTFNKKWNEKVGTLASGTLKSSLDRGNVRGVYQPMTLLDPSDTMKYSGSTAMIVHTQTGDELKFRVRMERAKLSTPYKLRWQTVQFHLKNLHAKLKRNQTTEECIYEILNKLQEVAIKGGSQTSLKRADFIQASQRMLYFEDMQAKQLSLLYSIFDPMKKNTMRYVELGSALTILDKPEQSTHDKLRALWVLNLQYGYDRNLFDIAMDILSACCFSNDEYFSIESAFRTEFKPKCYDMSVNDTGRDNNRYRSVSMSAPAAGKSGSGSARDTARGGSAAAGADAADGGAETGISLSLNAASHSTLDSSVAGAVAVGDGGGRVASADLIQQSRKQAIFVSNEKPFNGRTGAGAAAVGERTGVNGGDIGDQDQEFGALGEGMQPPKTGGGLSAQPQYNIAEHYLNDVTFIRVLRQCPSMSALVEEQISACLVRCYGTDIRMQVRPDEPEPEESWDFSWILGNKKK